MWNLQLGVRSLDLGVGILDSWNLVLGTWAFRLVDGAACVVGDSLREKVRSTDELSERADNHYRLINQDRPEPAEELPRADDSM